MSFIKNILPSTRLRIFRLHADVVLRPVSVYWMDFQRVMEKEKSAASEEAAPLCGIVEDYRTFVEDFKRVMEFVEWLEDGE